MTATVTIVACPRCDGMGYRIAADEPHTCPECGGGKGVEREWCDFAGHYVSVGATSPQERGSQYTICRTCRERALAAHEAAVEAAYRDAYGPDYDRLATYQAEGR